MTVMASRGFDPQTHGDLTAVTLSKNAREAALNLNAKAFEVRQPVVGIWELAPTGAEPPPAESIGFFDVWNSEKTESVIGEGDERVLVAQKDFAPGGKYRSIVKLLCTYEFAKPGQWLQGTGWLIRPDLLVSAGHCSYDWGHKLGRATEIKAYIGYNGRQSVSKPDVQFRRAKKIVVPAGWLRNKGVKNQDVSFIQLDKPFTGITPFKFNETSATGEAVLGVVGYPGDKFDKTTREKGAQMYEMFEKTRWDLGETENTMLEYNIDTFGGNSGSPVLVQGTNTSIGAHVYGGTISTGNSASVIGKFGHPYGDYVKAFDLAIPTGGAVHIVPLQTVGASGQTGFQPTAPQQPGKSLPIGLAVTAPATPSRALKPSPFGGASSVRPARRQVPRHALPSGHPAESDEEGILDIIKTAVKFGAPVLGGALKTGLPIALGPLGGPVGSLAGFALNAAAKLAESAAVDAEGAFDNGALTEGTLERAVLAEAAFIHLQSRLDDPRTTMTHAQEESIFSDMKDTVLRAMPTVKKVAGRVLPLMMEPALRVALDSLHKHNASNTESVEEEHVSFKPAIAYTEAVDEPSDAHTEGILDGLLHAGLSLIGAESAGADEVQEEGFGDFLKVALRVGKQGVSLAAKHGLPLLAQAIAGAGGTESDFEGSMPVSAGLSTDALAKRAVVSEAALQAILKMPPQQLQEEGWFDGIASVVKKIAPIALKVAPVVLDNVSPAVGGIFRKVTGQESSFAGVRAPGSIIRKQRSQILPRGHHGAGFLDRANHWHSTRDNVMY